MRAWLNIGSVGAKFLPFAEAVSAELPLSRLLRLSLFQLSVGMAIVLLTGTLNRVMIAELSVPAWIVSSMIALPMLFAPFRVLVGHRSDHHHSALGWRRGPFIWFGSLLQFGGLAIMPFALLVLSGDGTDQAWVGYVAAAIGFLITGVGLHTVQTSGLALATDIAPTSKRPQVVALLYVSLLAGMIVSSLAFGILLRDFSELRLIQVLQGAAVLTIALNLAALWKQEARRPEPEAGEQNTGPSFLASWRELMTHGGIRRLLCATGIGAAAFSMQDILLEPYGAQVLGMSVSGTTTLTAIFAAGSVFGFVLPARWLTRRGEPHRIAGLGILAGVGGLTAIVLSSGFGGQHLFLTGTATTGFGGGLFAVCTLLSVMNSSGFAHNNGIALGAWGAVQTSCAAFGVAMGGAIRDIISYLSQRDLLGPALTGDIPGYEVVYIIEIILLFVALAAIGPLARHVPVPTATTSGRFGIEAFPS